MSITITGNVTLGSGFTVAAPLEQIYVDFLVVAGGGSGGTGQQNYYGGGTSYTVHTFLTTDNFIVLG